MTKEVKNVQYGKESLYKEQKPEEGVGGPGHPTEEAMAKQWLGTQADEK